MINKVTMLSPATTSQQIALTPRSTVAAADGSGNAPTMPARRSMLETMYVNLDAGLRAFKEGQVHLVPVFKGGMWKRGHGVM